MLLLAISFFHLLLTSANSSIIVNSGHMKFGSHPGLFLTYKPTGDVLIRPDSIEVADQTRVRTLLLRCLIQESWNLSCFGRENIKVIPFMP